MKLTKQEFNHMVAINQIDVRPNDTAYMDGKKYKIQPVASHDTHVELKEIENTPSFNHGALKKQ